MGIWLEERRVSANGCLQGDTHHTSHPVCPLLLSLAHTESLHACLWDCAHERHVVEDVLHVAIRVCVCVCVCIVRDAFKSCVFCTFEYFESFVRC